MKRQATFNDVKVYNVSAGKSLPEWTEEAKKKNVSLRYNEEYRRRIELIHDFNFPVASNKVKISEDGEYIFAIGTYKPRCRIYETSQLGMKCERHMDAEAVQLEVLSEDYRKMVFMRCDRTLEFHVQYGRYHTTRIPKFGRDMLYSPIACDLYCGCSGDEVYRLNLEEGRFKTGFVTQSPAVNRIAAHHTHNILGFAGADGRLECWDPRAGTAAGVLDVSTQTQTAPELTALEFAANGLTVGCGTAGGDVLLYDLRSSVPLQVKTHNYGLPICDVRFGCDNKVFSADSKILKIWDEGTGEVVTNIEPPATINGVTVWPNSGLIFMAADTPKIQVFYVPSLGPAPKWCRFLDNLTEELEEEEHNSVYDDYKFVTRDELHGLGLNHLIGTNVLRAYMHGFFIDMRLYKKAKSVAEPFAYETYRQEQIDAKIAQERENRIAPVRKLPKVNTKLAERMLSGKHHTKASKAEKVDPSSLLQDDRFKAMWTDKNFTIDEQSDEYMRINPSARGGTEQKGSSGYGDDSDEDDQPDVDGLDEVEQSVQDEENFEAEGHGSDDESSSEDEHQNRGEQATVKSPKEPKQRKARLYQGTLDNVLMSAASARAKKRARAAVNKPLGDRAAREEEKKAKKEAKRLNRLAGGARSKESENSRRRGFDEEMSKLSKSKTRRRGN